jgi:acyl carrier protein
MDMQYRLCLKIIFAFFLHMLLEDFIKMFEAEISDITPNSVGAETVFKQLDAWNSMQALILIAMVDSEYGITLTAENLHDCITVSDLFSVVQNKKQQIISNP